MVSELRVTLVEPTVALVPPGTRFRFVPVNVMDAPGLTMVGEILEIVGRRTVRVCGLVAVTPDTVTVTGPVDAVAGTVTERVVSVDAVTVACAPPIVTAFCAGSVLNPVPSIVIVDPA